MNLVGANNPVPASPPPHTVTVTGPPFLRMKGPLSCSWFLLLLSVALSFSSVFGWFDEDGHHVVKKDFPTFANYTGEFREYVKEHGPPSGVRYDQLYEVMGEEWTAKVKRIKDKYTKKKPELPSASDSDVNIF